MNITVFVVIPPDSGVEPLVFANRCDAHDYATLISGFVSEHCINDTALARELIEDELATQAEAV